MSDIERSQIVSINAINSVSLHLYQNLSSYYYLNTNLEAYWLINTDYQSPITASQYFGSSDLA